VNEELRSERLRKPVALAILSSDVMSSSAYATEAMTSILVPVIGVAAFSLLVPITVGVLFVLVAVTASYLQVIKAFPKAGGAYIVTRESFGVRFAQVAAAALLIDYTLTVAVSVAAGVDALTSAVPALAHYTVELSVFFVLLIAYGNLRGIREAGKAFAIPTFIFIANMAILIVYGIFKYLTVGLPAHSLHQPGAIPIGHAGSGLLAGATLYLVLNAFSNGGSALTGTEAISNGVSIFRAPQARNARITLVVMSVILGTMFFGVSLLGSITHAIPRVSGTPTMVSQIATYVYGTSFAGKIFYFVLQASTTAILVLAANTSFTGFPFLASYAAADSFLPRQFTRRGHRLVFSSGIIVLTIVSIVLLVATRARVNSLIALYAIGVFTGFTLAGVGMVKHHLTRQESGWRWRVAVNGVSAVLTFMVDIIFIVTKFGEGAWVVVVLLPALVLIFLRLHAQYVREDAELERGLASALKAKTLKRHTIFVFVDRFDLATVRALQYAKTLGSEEIRAIHFQLDEIQAANLEREWKTRGAGGLDLEIIECPDRRLRRGAMELVLEALADRETEVTVLLPRRIYPSVLARVLHDQTADTIANVVGQLPNATATIVPFVVPRSRRDRVLFVPRKRESRESTEDHASHTTDEHIHPGEFVPGAQVIDSVHYRQRAKVVGRVARIRVGSSDAVPYLTVRLEDSTGGILLVFSGRKSVPGIVTGRKMIAEGMVGEVGGHLAILNPGYEFLTSVEADE
jgi:amino acid transporter